MNHSVKAIVAALSTATMLNLAGAPLDQGYFGFVALIPLMTLTGAAHGRRFVIGWLTGFTTQAFAYAWIFLTIRDFGDQSTAISAIGAVLFWLYQGLDIALWLWLWPLVFKRTPAWSQPFGAAATWLLIQSFLFPYVFPWTYGAVFSSTPWLAGAAALWGDQGLGFLAIAAQGFWLTPTIGTRVRIGSLLCLALAFVVGHGFRNEAETEDWQIAVIQPNLIPWAKRGRWTADDLYRAHAEPSLKLADQKPDLIVWPESALGFSLDHYPEYRNKLRALAATTGAALITGTIDYRADGKIYNEIRLIPPDGGAEQVYRKEKLVLFSERLPWILSWAARFDQALGGFRPGEDNHAFSYRGKEITPLVCFEALFSDYVRRRQGHLIVNLTNDAWFGKTKASWQHLQQIRLRSVENGAPLVRATNSGVSCWVDTRGAIRDAGGLYQAETFVFKVPLPVAAPVSRVGVGNLLVRCAGLIFLAWGLFSFSKKNKAAEART